MSMHKAKIYIHIFKYTVKSESRNTLPYTYHTSASWCISGTFHICEGYCSEQRFDHRPRCAARSSFRTSQNSRRPSVWFFWGQWWKPEDENARGGSGRNTRIAGPLRNTPVWSIPEIASPRNSSPNNEFTSAPGKSEYEENERLEPSGRNAHLNAGGACSVVVKVMDLDPQGRWFDPRCGHDKICTAVGPLSKALNPTLLQGVLSPA